MLLLLGPERQGPDETCIVMTLKPANLRTDFTDAFKAGLDERLRAAGKENSTNRIHFRPRLSRRASNASVKLPHALDSYVEEILVLATYAAYMTLVPHGEIES